MKSQIGPHPVKSSIAKDAHNQQRVCGPAEVFATFLRLISVSGVKIRSHSDLYWDVMTLKEYFDGFEDPIIFYWGFSEVGTYIGYSKQIDPELLQFRFEITKAPIGYLEHWRRV